MDNTTLFSSLGTVDTFEPATHELVQVQVFWSGWEKSISDVISKSLELLRRKNIGQGGSVGDSSGDGSNETNNINLSLSVSGNASREDRESGDSGKTGMSRGVRSSTTDEGRKSIQNSLGRGLLTTDAGFRKTGSSDFFSDRFAVVVAGSMGTRRGIRFSSSKNSGDSLRKSIGDSRVFNDLSDRAGKKSDESVLARLGIRERDIGRSVEDSSASGFISESVEIIGESRVGLGKNI